MVINPKLDGKVNKGTCLDHVIGGREFVFAMVPSEEGKHQQLLAREMQHGSDLAALLMSWNPGNCLLSLQFITADQFRRVEEFKGSTHMQLALQEIMLLCWNAKFCISWCVTWALLYMSLLLQCFSDVVYMATGMQSTTNM
jgi:hypothetical protein